MFVLISFFTIRAEEAIGHLQIQIAWSCYLGRLPSLQMLSVLRTEMGWGMKVHLSELCSESL